MAKPPDAALNDEAIPAQQPNAASPGPDVGQRRVRGRGGLIFAMVLIVLLVVSLVLALQDQG